jgi:amino acid adenylation domain-containing protein
MDNFTSLTARFKHIATSMPERVAVEDGERKITYRDLDQLSDQFAHGLAAKKIKSGSVIGLMLPRSWQQVVAILGIVKCGAVAAPLDRQSPRGRLKEMAEDVDCALVLVGAKGATIEGQKCVNFKSVLNAGNKTRFQAAERSKDALSFIFFTSGSTGKPKAVLVPERGVLRLGMQGYVPLDSSVRVAHVSNPSFDALNFDLWAPLLNGGTCVVFPDGSFDDFASFADRLIERKINTMFMTVALFNAIATENKNCFANLTTLLIGGEQINTQIVLKWYKQNPTSGCSIYNVYGPTECATFSLSYPIPREETAANAPIGLPLPGTKVTIVDADLRKVKDGLPGELLIAGDAVALGYHNREELTKQSFVKLNGKVHYRTGDQVQRNEDGSISYVGRIGRQVKIRGFRVEPGEIETILHAHEAIENAHVLTAVSAAGVLELHAYVVLGTPVSIEEVHDYLQAHLPTYMLPHHFYHLKQLPTNANGKIDREALLKSKTSRWQRERKVADLSQEARALCQIAASVLEQPDIDPTTTFLAAGGDSLSALRFKHQVARELKRSLAIADILSQPLMQLHAKSVPMEPLGDAPEGSDDGAWPVTSEQKRLWLDAQRYPDSRAYSVPLIFRIKGKVDPKRLDDAFSALFKKHASFRTAFREINGELMQVVTGESACSFKSFRTGQVKTKNWVDIANEVFSQPFDLSEPALCRAYWLPLNKQEGVLLINAHHIVLDGWSLDLLLQQLSAHYEGTLTADDIDAPEMGQFAQWQKAYFATENYQARREALRDMWVDQIEPSAPLPAQRAGDERGAFITRELFGPETAKIVRRCATRQSVTPFNLYLGAFSLAYAHITGEHQFKLVTPVSNRANPDFIDTIGMMANTMALPVDLAPEQTLKETFESNWALWAELLSYDDVAFEHFIEDMTRADRPDAGRFDAMFVLENTDYDQLQFSQCETRFELPTHVDGKAPITAFVLETADGPELIVEAQSQYFTQEDIDRLCSQFKTVLGGLMDMSLRVDQFTTPLGDELTAPSVPVAPKTITEMLQAQAALTPSTIAVVDGYHWLSYRALIQHSWTLIEELKAQFGDAERPQLIGVYIKPSREHIVALLALAQMNITILPLDPSYPQDMLRRIVDKAKPAFILTHPTAAKPDFFGMETYEVHLNQPSQTKPAPHAGENPLYTLYTSGSTGEPKGVFVYDDTLCNLLQWQKQDGLLGGAAVTQQFSKLSFDVSFQEIFATLTTGGTFHIIELEMRQDPTILLEAMQHNQVERIYLPFVALKLLAETALRSGIVLPYLKEVISAGEELVSTSTLKEWFGQLPQARLINHYGPSETHVVSAYNLPPDVAQWPDSAPIGRPIANVKFRINDAKQNAEGTGELLVSGQFVRSCYADDADNQKAFVTDTEGQVWYKTGDRVAIRRNHDLVYLGRLDTQIKLAGHRIELQQIEAVLNRFSRIALAIVVQTADNELTCFYEADGTEPSLAAINKHISDHFPDYVRINRLAPVSNWPKTPSGKIDRKKLISLKTQQTPSLELSASVTWATEIEEKLAELFKDVIRREIVPEQSFFEAGATSLDLIRFRNACQTAFDLPLPVALLFQFSTIEKLAQHMRPVTKSEAIVRPAVVPADEKMAIVGISIDVPGAGNFEAFSDLVINNKTGIERFEAQRGKIGARSQLANMLGFDPAYFGISIPEAKLMDPQQRHLLMGAIHCLQDAGVNPQTCKERVGVMASAGENTYFQDALRGIYEADLPDSFQMALHHDKDFLGTKIAYRLGLNGPAIAVQAACGSSLIGLHLAAGMLRNNDADMMLVGGCLIDATLSEGYEYRPQHIFSKDGLCRPFDKDASGTIGASGYGFVLLKPYSRALEDGNKIYGVLEGSAINNDGHDKMSYTAPSVRGQADVLTAALSNAGLAAEDVSLIEAHGTGTALGDPIEIEAIRQAYGPREIPLAVSSLKSQIGHMGAAAGLVGLIRGIVALQSKTLPPNLNFQTLNPEINLGDDPIQFPAQSKLWTSPSPRRAGISSFGIGGTNAHAIIGEAKQALLTQKKAAPLLLLSAHSCTSLQQWASEIADFLATNPSRLNDVLRFLQFGTPHLPYRAGFVVHNAQDAIDQLRQIKPTKKVRGQTETSLTDANIERVLEAWLGGATLQNLDSAAPRPTGFPLYPFELQHFELPRKTKATAQSELQDIKRLSAEQWLHAPAWQNWGRLAQDGERRPFAAIVHANELTPDQRQCFEQAYQEFVCIRISEHYGQPSPNQFTADLSRDDFARIGKQLDAFDHVAVDLIHFAPAQMGEALTNDNLELAQSYCLDAIPPLVSLADQLKGSELRIICVSKDGTDLASQPSSPLAGLLAGAQSVLSSERDFSSFWIDTTAQNLSDLAHVLMRNDLSPGRYGVRSGVLWSQQISGVSTNIADRAAPEHATYLVVGASGGIGQNICLELLCDHQVTLEITARSGELPPSLLPFTERINVHKVDLTDETASLPKLDTKIEGVVFAAGIASGATLSHRDAKTMRELNKVKTLGLLQLERWIESHQPRRVIYCSSMSAQLGGRGQLDYAGTNGLLDSFAHWVNPKSPHTIRTTINWDIWRESGMAVNALEHDPLHQKHLAFGLSDREGRNVFRQCLNTTQPQIRVSTLALDDALRFYRPSAAAAGALSKEDGQPDQIVVETIANLLGTDEISKEQRLDELGIDSLATLDLIDEIKARFGVTLQLSELPPSLRVEEIVTLLNKKLIPPETTAALQAMLKEVLGTDDFSMSNSFGELGLDSLLALDMIDAIKKQFEVQLPLSAFHEDATLNDVVQYVDEDLKDRQQATQKATPTPVSVECWQQSDGAKSICFIHPVGGEVAAYKSIFQHLPKSVSVFAISDPNLRTEPGLPLSIKERARDYLSALDSKTNGQRNGLELVGWSFGAWVAQEMCRLAECDGEEIAYLTMIDPPEPDCGSNIGVHSKEKIQEAFLYDLAPRLKHTHDDQVSLHSQIAPELQVHLDNLVRCCQLNMAAMQAHSPGRLSKTKVHLFVANKAADGLLVNPIQPQDHVQKWKERLTNLTHGEVLEADHYSIMQSPNNEQIIDQFFSDHGQPIRVPS